MSVFTFCLLLFRFGKTTWARGTSRFELAGPLIAKKKGVKLRNDASFHEAVFSTTLENPFSALDDARQIKGVFVDNFLAFDQERGRRVIAGRDEEGNLPGAREVGIDAMRELIIIFIHDDHL